MIKNYHRKNLVELKDLLFNPYYLCLDKNYREFLVKNALRKEGSLRIMAERIGCCALTLRHFRDLKDRSIQAESLRKLLSFSNISWKDAEQHVLHFRRGCTNQPVKINLPIKTTPELALLIAKVCGDGSILSDSRFHYTNNQLDLIKEVIDAVRHSIGKVDYYLLNRIDRRVYEIKFPPIIGHILHIVGAPQGYKLNQEFQIPKWIMGGSKKTKSAFLRGIFDDESCIQLVGRKTKRIVFAIGKKRMYQQSLEHFLRQMQKLLSEFKIQTSRLRVQYTYSNKIMMNFSIYGKNNFENFKRFVGYTHKKKSLILTKIILSYVDRHKTKKAIIATINEANCPLPIRMIAKLSKTNVRLTKFHLYNLLREKAIKKIEGYPTRWYVD